MVSNGYKRFEFLFVSVVQALLSQWYCELLLIYKQFQYNHVHCFPVSANLTCSNFKCPLGQSCLTNPDSGQPVCRTCKTFCLSTDLKQICGTDGRTYSTYCNMLMSSCNTGIYVTTKRSGRCKKQSKLHAMGNSLPFVYCFSQFFLEAKNKMIPPVVLTYILVLEACIQMPKRYDCRIPFKSFNRNVLEMYKLAKLCLVLSLLYLQTILKPYKTH